MEVETFELEKTPISQTILSLNAPFTQQFSNIIFSQKGIKKSQIKTLKVVFSLPCMTAAKRCIYILQ